jgi:hypothetical protein
MENVNDQNTLFSITAFLGNENYFRKYDSIVSTWSEKKAVFKTYSRLAPAVLPDLTLKNKQV